MLALTRKEFERCWPVGTDHAKRRQFRSVAHRLLVRLTKVENHPIPSSYVKMTLLMRPSGDRYCTTYRITSIYFVLSTHHSFYQLLGALCTHVAHNQQQPSVSGPHTENVEEDISAQQKSSNQESGSIDREHLREREQRTDKETARATRTSQPQNAHFIQSPLERQSPIQPENTHQSPTAPHHVSIESQPPDAHSPQSDGVEKENLPTTPDIAPATPLDNPVANTPHVRTDAPKNHNVLNTPARKVGYLSYFILFWCNNCSPFVLMLSAYRF